MSLLPAHARTLAHSAARPVPCVCVCDHCCLARGSGVGASRASPPHSTRRYTLRTCRSGSISPALSRLLAEIRSLLRASIHARETCTRTQCIGIMQAGALYPGSKFVGEQRSKRSQYGVAVEIKACIQAPPTHGCGTALTYHVVVLSLARSRLVQHVDLNASLLTGYLSISGLTEEFPVLTTYFEGEIIGPCHSFLTRKWDACEYVDKQHWSKFSAFAQFKKLLSSAPSDERDLPTLDNDAIFMRWKVRTVTLGSAAHQARLTCRTHAHTHRSTSSCPTTRSRACLAPAMTASITSATRAPPTRSKATTTTNPPNGTRMRLSHELARANPRYLCLVVRRFQALQLAHVPEQGTASYQFA